MHSCTSSMLGAQWCMNGKKKKKNLSERLSILFSDGARKILLNQKRKICVDLPLEEDASGISTRNHSCDFFKRFTSISIFVIMFALNSKREREEGREIRGKRKKKGGGNNKTRDENFQLRTKFVTSRPCIPLCVCHPWRSPISQSALRGESL